MLMYAFGVTLWEIFSSHVPYDNDKKPAQELIEELKDLLTDADDPLRPDLDLVDPRVRQLLQVSSLALKSFLSLLYCRQLIFSTAALLGHGSQRQNQRC